MAATVTRPSASVMEESKTEHSGPQRLDWPQYIRWIIIAAFVITAVGLGYSFYATYAEGAHLDVLRGQWDEYYKALKDVKTDDERIGALEKLADNPKIKGTTVHAYALAELAKLNFELSQNFHKDPEFRGDSLTRATSLYKMMWTMEPFKSYPSFGPIALQNLCMALEEKESLTLALAAERAAKKASDDAAAKEAAAKDPAKKDEPKKDAPDEKEMVSAGTPYYDEAIETLQTALYKDKSKDAEPVKAMKAHFLFYKLNAELGRLYWLRGQRKIELDKEKSPAAAKDDYGWSLNFIKIALEGGMSSVEKDRFSQFYSERYGKEFKGAWREEAAYIKSLLDPIGKMMPDGVAPPAKPEPVATPTPAPAPAPANNAHPAPANTVVPPPANTANPPANGTKPPVNNANPPANNTKPPANNANPPANTTNPPANNTNPPANNGAIPAKPDEKKPDAKTPASFHPKSLPPVEPVASQRNVPADPAEPTAGDDGPPQQHMSYSQIQALLKQGRPAMCQCPRCVNAAKSIGAKLAE